MKQLLTSAAFALSLSAFTVPVTSFAEDKAAPAATEEHHEHECGMDQKDCKADCHKDGKTCEHKKGKNGECEHCKHHKEGKAKKKS